MTLVFDALITLISLAFLGILGTISAVAIPALFIAVAAPWLDRFLPFRRKQS